MRCYDILKVLQMVESEESKAVQLAEIVLPVADSSAGPSEESAHPQEIVDASSLMINRDDISTVSTGTQCSIGVRTLKSASTQTCQTEFPPNPTTSTQWNKTDFIPSFYEECYGLDDESLDSSSHAYLSTDSFYKPPSELDYSSDGSSSISSIPDNDFIHEDKYIVFRSSLNALLGHTCKTCGSPVIDQQERTQGTMLTIKTFCINGHTFSWNSQPIVNSMASGNLLTSAAILFSGNTFSKVNQLATYLNLKFISHTTYYTIQSNYLFPVINNAWLQEQSRVLNAMKIEGRPVILSGDGRCDSPGHNAKYGTYTMMTETGKVAVFSIVQVTEVTSSNAMEKEGFERCFNQLNNNEIKVNQITTDRHPSISCAIKTNHKETKHQYDIWHVAKGVSAKVEAKAKKNECKVLREWRKSITNHLWWCCRTCGGNVEILREKWKSILYHVTNTHKWQGNNYFHACAHAPLTDDERRKKKWLKPGTEPYVALEDIVLNRKLLKDMEKMTSFCHTGELEVYHSMMLKYCPKRQHFSYSGMQARTQLSALDNNSNIGREQAKTKAGKCRYRVAYQKAQRQWVAKPVRERNSYHFAHELIEDVVTAYQQVKDTKLPVALPPNPLPRNIANTPAPDKETLIQCHKSRFK